MTDSSNSGTTITDGSNTSEASSSSDTPDPCEMVKWKVTRPEDWNLLSLDQLVPNDGCVRGARRRLTDAGGSFD